MIAANPEKDLCTSRLLQAPVSLDLSVKILLRLVELAMGTNDKGLGDDSPAHHMKINEPCDGQVKIRFLSSLSPESFEHHGISRAKSHRLISR
ncbi:hypothetical protein CI238_03134 [Colletotrichum incanum]|uniref:Uncharacterized protein n=1 Tax=Colletotrichum incanum TaxID=1573173 RepID=A0A161W5T8_COLIC|nr:hypothetical protein CI238_03134 [Colletotrichum incanum]